MDGSDNGERGNTAPHRPFWHATYHHDVSHVHVQIHVYVAITLLTWQRRRKAIRNTLYHADCIYDTARRRTESHAHTHTQTAAHIELHTYSTALSLFQSPARGESQLSTDDCELIGGPVNDSTSSGVGFRHTSLDSFPHT